MLESYDIIFKSNINEDKNPNNIIHFLWIGTELSNLELLSLESHIQNNYTCYLWTYQDILNVPKHILIKDANEIVDESKIFTYKVGNFSGSLAGFADYFRLNVIHKYGGWWKDIDNVCLNYFELQSEYLFATEKKRNNLIDLAISSFFCHKNTKLLEECIQISNTILDTKKNIWWGEIGASLMSKLIKLKNLNCYYVPYNYFCPINWYEARNIYIANNLCSDINSKLYYNSYNIHMYNEMIRRLKIDKNKPQKYSLYYNLLKKYNII
jgi:hypothetical protein